jgi:hypothetical protein
MAVEEAHDTHLFSYRFNGRQFTVDIVATDAAEARERLKALAWAKYDGVLVARVPSRAGLFARLAVVVRNVLHTTMQRPR